MQGYTSDQYLYTLTVLDLFKRQVRSGQVKILSRAWVELFLKCSSLFSLTRRTDRPGWVAHEWIYCVQTEKSLICNWREYATLACFLILNKKF